jgi:hypothetical protein
LDYNLVWIAVNRWLKLVAFLLIAGIAGVVVSPDLDLQPTVARVSHATQKPPVVAFTAIAPATNRFSSLHSFTASPLRSSFRGSLDYPADLIDLHCVRLC